MLKRIPDPRHIDVLDEAVAAVFRQKTPAEKLQLVFDANHTLRLSIEGALRTWHPDWSYVQIEAEIARRMTRASE